MTSKVVRDAFRSAWSSKVPTIPLYETINARPASPSGTWATVEFSGDVESVSLSGKTDERGQILIAILAPAGGGDGTAMTAAETVRAAFGSWYSKDGAGETVVTNVGPATSAEEQQGGDFFVVTFAINYLRMAA